MAQVLHAMTQVLQAMTQVLQAIAQGLVLVVRFPHSLVYATCHYHV
jgi:hypothetical protein